MKKRNEKQRILIILIIILEFGGYQVFLKINPNWLCFLNKRIKKVVCTIFICHKILKPISIFIGSSLHMLIIVSTFNPSFFSFNFFLFLLKSHRTDIFHHFLFYHFSSITRVVKSCELFIHTIISFSKISNTRYHFSIFIKSNIYC